MVRLSMFVGLVAVAVCVASGAGAQQQFADASAGPRFLLARSPQPVRIDVDRTPLLMRRLNVDLDGVTRKEALDAIARMTGLQLLYSSEVVPLGTRVRLQATGITVAAALTDLLVGAQVDVVFDGLGGATLVKRLSGVQLPLVGIVTGRVTDSTTNDGILGVSISIQGTRLGATTGSDGRYTMRGVPAGEQTIVVRRLGYRTRSQAVTVRDNETVVADLVLARVPTSLREIVVTPTGERQRLEVGNTIGTIKADSLVPTTLIRNMSDLLQARVPGVIVTNTTGMVGAPSKVRVRGINSVRLNNDPIIILDGVRLHSQVTFAESQVNAGGQRLQVLSNSAGSTNGPGGGGHAVGGLLNNPMRPSPLDDIDPNTIESIDVLFGPSAASLYGTEAANGVIVIKTKRGSAGPMRFSLSADAGQFKVPGRLPEHWFGWGHLADGTPTTNCRLAVSTGGFRPAASVADGTCTLDSATAFNPQNHPQMTTLGTGSSRSIVASMSGGTSVLQQFLSARISDEVGIPKMSDVERRRFERNDVNPPPWMLRPNTQDAINASSRTSIRIGSTLDLSLTANGNYRSVLNNQWAGAQSADESNTGPVSPITGLGDTLRYLSANGSRAKLENTTKRGFVSLTANHTPLTWLSLRGSIGGDYIVQSDESLVRATECAYLGCASSRGNSRNETFVRSLDIGAQASFAPSEWLKLRTSIGEDYRNTQFSSLFATNNNSGTDLAFGSDLLSPGPVPRSPGVQLYQVGEARDEAAVAGWYLEQMVGVRERLFLTGALRQDAASGFGQSVNENAPIYPKFSASWLVSEEPRFPWRSLFTSVRLRFAYGHSGQQAGQGDVANNYGQFSTWVAGQRVPGIVLSQIGNPELKPERTAEAEGGLDLSMFGNERLQLSATFYRKRTEDAIFPVGLPASYGTTSQFRTENLIGRQNVGTVENRGAELSLTGKVIDMRAIGWELTLNATKNMNELVHRSSTTTLSPTQFREGYPLYGNFGQKILSYADVDGDGVLAFSEALFSDTTFLGAPYPSSELTYGSRATFFSGALSINGIVDQLNGLATTFDMLQPGVYDRTQSLAAQAAALEVTPSFGIPQTFRDATVVRLAELSATYILPVMLSQRYLRARSASVTMAGRNLAFWTNYVGMDPNVGSTLTERRSEGGCASSGCIPQPRNWTIRVNLGF